MLDQVTNSVIAESAGNRYLYRAMTGIRAIMRRDLEIGAELKIRRLGDLQLPVDEHRTLVEAIAARDPDAARVAMIAVIERNREHVLGMYSLPSEDGSRQTPTAG